MDIAGAARPAERGKTMHQIAVVRGAPSAVVQVLLTDFVGRWGSEIRIAGVLAEGHGLPDRACNAGYLRTVSGGERFAMFQDLGSGSTACHLEAAGVVEAAERVRDDIAAGCDLVVLSKFGKLEAAGGGLRNAFTAAIETGVPVLTSVSPAFDTPWRELVSPLYSVLAADAAALDDWWRAVRPSCRQTLC
jgi:uncharacterized protein DUF2478